MSNPPHPDHDDAPAAAAGLAGFALDDGGFVVYDPDREAAWLQSDAPVTLSEWQ